MKLPEYVTKKEVQRSSCKALVIRDWTTLKKAEVKPEAGSDHLK